MKAKDVKTTKQAFEFYKAKALEYMELACLHAEMGEDNMAKLMIGFYNTAVRDMEHFERMLK